MGCWPLWILFIVGPFTFLKLTVIPLYRVRGMVGSESKIPLLSVQRDCTFHFVS